MSEGTRLFPGKTERRLALVVLLVGVLPLAAALWLAASLFRQASGLWWNPAIGEQLDRGVEVYKDYVKAVKDDLKHQTVAIAADETLREAAQKRNVELLEPELDRAFAAYPNLVSLEVLTEGGDMLARRDRGRPVDEDRERSLDVVRPLGDDPDAPQLAATFAVPRQRLDELEVAGAVVARYHQVESSRSELYGGYLDAFTAVLVVTALATVALGILLARGVTRRITRLGAALDVAAQGDLSVRVPVTGSDELTEVARSFNRMLAEVASSRARIEFLQRMGAWQEMAQRLAHEIKNPLTPIQLAVEECHRRYEGDDPKFRGLLSTTREIVDEEIGTLRRLVTNFSSFARLPHAELRADDLRAFLAECAQQLGHLEDPSLGEASADAEPLALADVKIAWRLPEEGIVVAIDRQMLRRVIVNLVRNAVQAVHGTRSEGHVVVSAERDDDGGARVAVDDDGPGLGAPDVAPRVFEPYFTTKEDGTGLGLAIVKRIVVEHGGTVEGGPSPTLGGARFVVRLRGPEVLEPAEALKLARERARREGVEGVDRPASG